MTSETMNEYAVRAEVHHAACGEIHQTGFVEQDGFANRIGYWIF